MKNCPVSEADCFAHDAQPRPALSFGQWGGDGAPGPPIAGSANDLLPGALPLDLPLDLDRWGSAPVDQTQVIRSSSAHSPWSAPLWQILDPPLTL